MYKVIPASIITFSTMSFAYLLIPKDLSPGMMVFVISSIVYLVLNKSFVTN
ncbi:hypothetical protein MHH33_06535 [Paenisporosarcina sp. FSL H8-0542]|uniref:hypothetical protein n=1 Tax=Paenisporosarcina sp. FSL H8-0542 TaxID=2921401 RepID=UPI00315AAD61